jgi:hypothetical protein
VESDVEKDTDTKDDRRKEKKEEKAEEKRGKHKDNSGINGVDETIEVITPTNLQDEQKEEITPNGIPLNDSPNEINPELKKEDVKLEEESEKKVDVAEEPK